MARNIHVLLKHGSWEIKREQSLRASSIHRTQTAAINVARPIAKREKTELVIHGLDGKIRDKDSYGNDPYPPRDKKH